MQALEDMTGVLLEEMSFKVIPVADGDHRPLTERFKEGDSWEWWTWAQMDRYVTADRYHADRFGHTALDHAAGTTQALSSGGLGGANPAWMLVVFILPPLLLCGDHLTVHEKRHRLVLREEKQERMRQLPSSSRSAIGRRRHIYEPPRMHPP